VREVEPCPAKLSAELPVSMFAKFNAEFPTSRPKTFGPLMLTSPSFFVEVFAEFDALELSMI
jgi:hypothetical protein